MPIPWMLVWFGVLGHQDRASNFGVGLEINWEVYTLRNFGKFLQEKRSRI